MKKATEQSLDALSRGINAELAAYVFYKRAVEKIKDKELSSLLERLAGEEKDHYRTLEAEYDSLVRSEKWVTYNDIMCKTGLPDIPEEITDAHRTRLNKLDHTNDNGEIIKMAISLEEDARDFYQSQIARVADPAAVEVYTFLTRFEQGHVNLLTTWLKKV